MRLLVVRVYNDDRKRNSVIVNLIESYGHDTRPLFLSLSSIAPSEAVSLFRLCLLQCSEKAQEPDSRSHPKLRDILSIIC